MTPSTLLVESACSFAVAGNQQAIPAVVQKPHNIAKSVPSLLTSTGLHLLSELKHSVALFVPDICSFLLLLYSANDTPARRAQTMTLLRWLDQVYQMKPPTENLLGDSNVQWTLDCVQWSSEYHDVA